MSLLDAFNPLAHDNPIQVTIRGAKASITDAAGRTKDFYFGTSDVRTPMQRQTQETAQLHAQATRQRARRRASPNLPQAQPGGALADRPDIALVKAAAAKHGVPEDVLLGVYGLESTFGSNPKDSSAGAQGPFQFEPATGAGYGLDTPAKRRNLSLAADAAARKLANDAGPGHDWGAAIRKYGGGYSLADVLAEAKHAPGGGTTGGPESLGAGVDYSTPGAATGVAEELKRIADAFGAFAGLLTPEGMKRILLIVIGGVATLWAIQQLSKSLFGANPVAPVNAAAKASVLKSVGKAP